MASTYKKGDVLKVKSTPPQGAVEKIQMTEDGVVQYLISWVDADGNSHQRWFDETDVEQVV
jgi:uncharacterized protein YodC (DUF2158 family)